MQPECSPSVLQRYPIVKENIWYSRHGGVDDEQLNTALKRRSETAIH
jgi:hypothetical protein